MNMITFMIETLIAFLTEHTALYFIGKYRTKHFSADMITRNEADRCTDVCIMNLVSLQSIQSLAFTFQSDTYLTQIGKAPARRTPRNGRTRGVNIPGKWSFVLGGNPRDEKFPPMLSYGEVCLTSSPLHHS